MHRYNLTALQRESNSKIYTNEGLKYKSEKGTRQ